MKYALDCKMGSVPMPWWRVMVCYCRGLRARRDYRYRAILGWQALMMSGPRWWGEALTVIESPVYDIGAMAMEMLLARLNNPQLAKRKRVLNGTLLARGSTARRECSSSLQQNLPLYGLVAR